MSGSTTVAEKILFPGKGGMSGMINGNSKLKTMERVMKYLQSWFLIPQSVHRF